MPNRGEERMYQELLSEESTTPEASKISNEARDLLAAAFLALSTIDSEGRPWTTVWGGEMEFARQVAPSFAGIKIHVDHRYDPVVEALLGASARAGNVDMKPGGFRVSIVAINLEAHRSVKFAGEMVAGSLSGVSHGNGEIKIILKLDKGIDSSTEFITKTFVAANMSRPSELLSHLPLADDAITLVNEADTFFMSFSTEDSQISTSYRLYSPNFIKILHNEEGRCILIYRDFDVGFFQSAESVTNTPKASLVVPDFDSGNVLYITGKTNFHVGLEAASLSPGSSIVARITVLAARFVRNGLGFRVGDAQAWTSGPIRSLNDNMDHQMS